MTVSTGENREAAALAQQLTSDEPKMEQQVPVHVLQSIRQEYDQKLKAVSEQNEALKNHFQMMQWKQNQAPAAPPVNPLQGKDPKDSILVEDAMRLAGEMEARFNAQLSEIKLASRDAAYKEVINKFLPKAAEEDPAILSEIQRSPDPINAAYRYAKSSKAYMEEQMSNYRSSLNPPPAMNQSKPKPDPEAERIIQNSKQSGNLASVASRSTSSGEHPEFDRMSDSEFRAYKSSLRFKTAGR